MPLRRWILPLVAAFAFGQEAAPFPEEAPSPWKPAWELTLRGDQVRNPVDAEESFKRTDLQLRLRWTWEREGFRFVAGTRSAIGSDGNSFNSPRWDQQPSNGTQLDVAQGEAAWASPGAFANLNLNTHETASYTADALPVERVVETSTRKEYHECGGNATTWICAASARSDFRSGRR